MKRANDRRNRAEKGVPCFDTEQSLCWSNGKRKSGKDSTRPVRKASALCLLIVLLFSCGLWVVFFLAWISIWQVGREAVASFSSAFPPRCVSCSVGYSLLWRHHQLLLLSDALKNACTSGYVTTHNIIHQHTGITFKCMLLFNKYEVSSLNYLSM